MKQTKKMRNYIVSVVIVIFMITSVVQVGIQNKIAGNLISEDTSDIEIPSYITSELVEGQVFEQVFIPDYSYITEFRTVMFHVGDGCQGIMYYTISDEQGKVIVSKQKEIQDIKAGDWTSFEVNRYVQEGKRYRLKLSVEGISEAPNLMLINSAFDTDENQEAYIDGTQIAGGSIITFGYKETVSLLFRILTCLAVIATGMIALFFINVEQASDRMKAILMKADDLKNSVFLLSMALLILLMLFLHLFRLSGIPFGIHVDEMGMGYDAYCIANWGVDRFQMSYPVYFINIGTGQNALYTYMAAVCIKVFGYSEYILRIPAVINAILTVIFGAGIVWKKWRTKKSVVLFTALFSILPIFIMVTRFGLESYLLLGFSALFLFTLIQAVEDGKLRYYIIAGMCGGILLYTYAISYLVMIIFLIMGLGYLIYIKKINWKQIIAFAVPLGVIAYPLILCQIINMFDLSEIKFGLITITKLQGYRGSEITLKHIVSNFVECMKDIFWHDSIHYNSFPEYMTMYWVSIPFALMGFCHSMTLVIQSIKRKEWDVTAVMLLWFSSMLAIGCLLGGNGPNCNKVNGIYIACLYFIVDGMICLMELSRRESWMKGVLVVSVISYITCFISFTDYYFYRYVKDYYPEEQFETTYGDAINALNAQGDSIANRTTYIEESSAIYFCGSTLISPYEFDYYNDTKQFNQYVFHYITSVEPESNYILRDNNKSYAIELERNGFMVQKVGAWFVCYKIV